MTIENILKDQSRTERQKDRRTERQKDKNAKLRLKGFRL